MAEVDLKQKIKEVRDKFLSNNQIEDIRQNITLGVEERLKNLSTEQIKVIELLKEKYLELSNLIQLQNKRIDDEVLNNASSLNDVTSGLATNLNQQALKLEQYSGKILEETKEETKAVEQRLETRLNNKISDFEKKLGEQALNLEQQSRKNLAEAKVIEKNSKEELESDLKAQSTFVVTKFEELAKEQTQLMAKIDSSESKFHKIITENTSYLKDLSNKNSSELENTQELLLKALEEKEGKITKDVNDKLSVYETEKKDHLADVMKVSTDATSKLEIKIKVFLENHQTVEEIIDNRLTEFRNAQKAAFEELEAALTLLEKHQDETITRFRHKSELGIKKQFNIPHSSPKNRGSIFHQPAGSIEDAPTLIDTEIDIADLREKKSLSVRLFTPLIVVTLSALLILGVAHYFKVDFNSVLKQAKSFFE